MKDNGYCAHYAKTNMIDLIIKSIQILIFTWE